jgi:hypothetical protein
MREFGTKWLKAREDFDQHRERVPTRISCYGPERKSCPRSNVEIDDRMAGSKVMVSKFFAVTLAF